MKMAEAKLSPAKVARPLSPHLQIYKPTLTMMMSIAHRVSGGALYYGMLFLAWWLLAAASGPNAYGRFQWFMGSVIGILVLVAITFALLLHMLGGIRHLIWDLGYGFGPVEREWLGRATLFGAIALTAILTIIGFVLTGKA
jgi:succinate dehydrogenase / fumarate reductase cytochrome b subunit